jgi:membrane-bound ClpP family serine protease
MTWTIIAVLIIVGFVFLLLEILVLPGTNVAGIIGFVLLVVGVWQAYATFGGKAGTITLIATVIVSAILLYYSLQARTWRRVSLKSEISSKVNVVDNKKVKPGDTGKTISRLAPMGKAYVNGVYVEVSSDGEFIDQNTEIEIIKIDHNKIVVKPLNK